MENIENIEQQNSVDSSKEKELETKNYSNDAKKTIEEGGYFGYYIFVFISAIIGFITVFFVTRLYLLDFFKNKFDIDLVSHKSIVAVMASLIAVILFMFISLCFKKVLKMIFMSEVFLYIYIGFLTTMISIISFKLLNDNLNPSGEENSLGWIVAEVLAFIIAVTFSFFADKLIVFKSYSFIPTKLFGELGLFVSARLLTEGINIFVMYLIINVLKNEPMVGKITASVIVIVLNYLFSKFIIFKKKNKVMADVTKSSVVDKTAIENNVKEFINEEIKEDKSICE